MTVSRSQDYAKILPSCVAHFYAKCASEYYNIQCNNMNLMPIMGSVRYSKIEATALFEPVLVFKIT